MLASRWPRAAAVSAAAPLRERQDRTWRETTDDRRRLTAAKRQERQTDTATKEPAGRRGHERGPRAEGRQRLAHVYVRRGDLQYVTRSVKDVRVRRGDLPAYWTANDASPRGARPETPPPAAAALLWLPMGLLASQRQR